MFGNTFGRGFHLRFSNGWLISVQWGVGNYCSRRGYQTDFYHELKQQTSSQETWTSPDAEVAVWHTARPDGMVSWGHDTVIGHLSTDAVAKIIAMISQWDSDLELNRASARLQALMDS